MNNASEISVLVMFALKVASLKLMIVRLGIEAACTML